MGDRTVDRLVSYAGGLRFEDLPPEVVHQAKRVLVDSLGCGLGAFTSEPARIARDLAAGVHGEAEATVLGTRQRGAARWPLPMAPWCATSTSTTRT
jgi:2-methylcitrate dehydratase